MVTQNPQQNQIQQNHTQQSRQAVQAPRNQLFRKEALEQTASPERLDQLVKVVSPKRWLSLAALGTLVAAGLTWSIFGRIPITVKGQGVLVYPSKVVNVQSPSSGRLLALTVKTGEHITKGQVIATIDQSELQKELQLTREKLAQLQIQDQAATSAQTQRNSLDQSATAQQRQALQQSLETVQKLTPVLREKGVDSIQKDRQALQQRLQTLRNLLPVYLQRWQARQQANEQGALSKDQVLQAQQEYENARAETNQAESQLKQLDVKEADAQREYLSNLNQINQLQAQIKELDSRIATQREQDLTSAVNRKKEIQETQRSIAQLEAQIQQNSQVISAADGTVLELAAKPGDQLQPGAGIGTISTATSDRLVSVVFVPVSEGKKLTPGLSVQTTPTIVKREEFGGITGKINEVSAFPVTQQGAASLVGNSDILPGVLEKGAQIAVFADLQPGSSPDTYHWSSSQGPNQKITAGMTTSVQITVEERSPISYVLPILKSLTGWS
jgi:HlyD family secretion protein